MGNVYKKTIAMLLIIITISILSDTNCAAINKSYTICIASDNGSVSLSKSGESVPEGYSYPVGCWVQLTASPDCGYYFKYWIVDGSIYYGSRISLTADANDIVSINAVFINNEERIPTPTMAPTPTPTTIPTPTTAATPTPNLPPLTIAPNNPSTIAPKKYYSLDVVSNNDLYGITEGSGAFIDGTTTSIRAIAAPHYKFVNWTGDVDSPTSPETTIMMNEDKVVTANFIINIYKLVISKIGKGTGKISDYKTNYNALSSITLTAVPDDKNIFCGWYNDSEMISNDSTYSFTIMKDTVLYAKFEPKPNKTDVTDSIQVIGNPFSKQTYARNVWDMQVFNDSIYLGHGNSSNEGPSPNAGPIDVIKFVPATNEFIKEYTVNEEQIDTYKVINNRLYIPGHDPLDSWSYGNFYSLESQWNKVRTLPNAVHIYDMLQYNNKLYAATCSNGSTLLSCSTDNGKTWQEVNTSTPFYTITARAYSMFEFKGKLYASNSFLYTNRTFQANDMICIDGDNASVINVNATKMFPNITNNNSYIKIVKPTVVNEKLLYIAGSVNNDHQHIPIALFVSNDVGNASKITFKESSAIPYDILVRCNTAYVLASVKVSSGKYTNIVYQSDDISSWTEVMRFTSDTFARSFEELNGDFYFGLGCNTDVLPESTGTILKVSYSDY